MTFFICFLNFHSKFAFTEITFSAKPPNPYFNTLWGFPMGNSEPGFQCALLLFCCWFSSSSFHQEMLLNAFTETFTSTRSGLPGSARTVCCTTEWYNEHQECCHNSRNYAGLVQLPESFSGVLLQHARMNGTHQGTGRCYVSCWELERQLNGKWKPGIYWKLDRNGILLVNCEQSRATCCAIFSMRLLWREWTHW